MTIRNESAPVLLQQRQQSMDKKNAAAEVKKLKKTIIKLQIFIIGAATTTILYLGWGRILNPGSNPGVESSSAVTVLIQFNAEEQLGPDGHAARDFFVKHRQNVTINILAQCLICADEALMIYIFDEYNYRRFASSLPYDTVDISVDDESYVFNRSLEEGHYYVVLRNNSMIQEILIKINAAWLTTRMS